MTGRVSDVSYGQILRSGKKFLQDAGITEYGTDAWLLLSFAADLDRNAYFLNEMKPVPTETADRYRQLLTRRAAHVPLQHITGTQDFYGYTFLVTKDVLIPRQDTEVLAQQAVTVLKGISDTQNPAVLDLCTGSGCLAVTIAKEVPGSRVTASDISPAALAVASENAVRLGTDVEFVRSDLFENIPGIFDCIVSNPPYIPTREIEDLSEEVRCGDPLLALDGGQDGLSVYRALIPACPAHLKRGGTLLLEIGAEQAEAVGALLDAAHFTDIRVIKDLAGLDRVVSARTR